MKKIIDFSKSLLNEYFDLIIFVIAVAFVELFTRVFCNCGFAKPALVLDLKYISYIFIVLLLIKQKVRKWIVLFITVLVSAYGFSESLHYAFFETLFSFRKITVAKELANVRMEILSKLSIKYLLFLIPIILVILVIRFIKIKNKETNYIFRSAVIVLLLLFSFQANKMTKKAMEYSNQLHGWRSDLYLHNAMHNNTKFFERFGIFDYAYFDAKRVIVGSSLITLSDDEKSEIEMFINNNSNYQDNDKTGIYYGKNLILILCESLNNFPINKDLTPTLYMLSEKGTYYLNYYAPLYQSATCDSEFISLTSMLPSIDFGTTSESFVNNDFIYALPQLLKDRDYNVNSYHSYISNFYNREIFHASLGFDTFYDESKLGIERANGYFEGKNWNYDSDLFKKTIEHTKIESDKPFFDFVITTSGHMPYVEDRNELKENLEVINNLDNYKDLPSEVKCYYAVQMNLDKGLKTLLDELKNKGILDDTIIALYGDHYPYGITDEGSRGIVLKEGYEQFRNPFIIYDPTEEGYKDEKLASTFDVYPTLCNLFGLNRDNSYVVGRDLNSDENGMVVFMNRSLLTEDYYYDSDTGETIVLTDNYNEKQRDDDLERVNDIFNYGQLILRSNYYAK